MHRLRLNFLSVLGWFAVPFQASYLAFFLTNIKNTAYSIGSTLAMLRLPIYG
jgi:hypothetical protein